MHKKNVAIYVEGQTEQIFANNLIRKLFDYQHIEIQNIKLNNNEDSSSVIGNYSINNPAWVRVFFLIVNIEGDKSLPSALAKRAPKQIELGYEILALRDLYSGSKIKNIVQSLENTMNEIRAALKIVNFHKVDQVDFFFAIQEIETWLIPFSKALSKWANISKEDVLKKTKVATSLEELDRPGKIVNTIAAYTQYTNHKSFDAMNSLISKIDLDEVNDVYHSLVIPSFNKFLDRLSGLKNFAFQEIQDEDNHFV